MASHAGNEIGKRIGEERRRSASHVCRTARHQDSGIERFHDEPLEARGIRIHERVFPGRLERCEVAIGALAHAEGNMQVERTRRHGSRVLAISMRSR